MNIEGGIDLIIAGLFEKYGVLNISRVFYKNWNCCRIMDRHERNPLFVADGL